MATILKKTTKAEKPAEKPADAPAATEEPAKEATNGKPVGKQLKGAEAVATISTAKPNGEETQQHESLGNVATNGASLSFGLGRKFTDGNYGSYDYRVSLTMPFDSTDPDALEATYEKVTTWVDGKLTELLGPQKPTTAE